MSSCSPKSSLIGGLCATLVFLFCLPSCSKTPLSEDARISIEPASADFGTISANDPIAFHNVSLDVRNLGKETLHITHVEFPEGFSYSIVPRKTIETGNKASLRITMDIRKFSGQVSETAYVLSNDPARPRAPLILEASIVGVRSDQVFEVGDEADIKFDHKAVDLGTVARHQSVEHSFDFKNIGKRPLKIIMIETMCKCLTGTPTKSVIPPGESAAIMANFEAYKWGGHALRKALFITTDDPDEPAICLTVIARIVDVVTLNPEEVFLPNIQLGQSATAEVELIQGGKEEVMIESLETSSPKISVTTEPFTDDRKGHLLTITVAPDMPEGKFEELVTIYTNYADYSTKRPAIGAGTEKYKDYSRLELPVKGTVTGAISVTPRTINFGASTPGQSLSRKLFVSSTGSPFEIKSSSLSDPSFHTSYSPIEPGRKYEITVQFLPEESERQIEDKLVINTTITTVVVPIFASVRLD